MHSENEPTSGRISLLAYVSAAVVAGFILGTLWSRPSPPEVIAKPPVEKPPPVQDVHNPQVVLETRFLRLDPRAFRRGRYSLAVFNAGDALLKIMASESVRIDPVHRSVVEIDPHRMGFLEIKWTPPQEIGDERWYGMMKILTNDTEQKTILVVVTTADAE